MRTGLNFNHLECFFALAKNLSFSKTSQELKIAQPAVSKQIKSLEQFFDQQLFLRTRHNVQLTHYGKNLFNQLAPLYQEICKRVDDIVSDDGTLKGKIVFGCLKEIGERVFIKPLSLFKEDNPNVLIEIKFLKSYEILEGIKDGSIDVGIVAQKTIQENVRCYQILSEEIVLVTGRNNGKQKVTQLSDVSLVAYRENDPLLQYYLQKVYPKNKLGKLNIDFMVNSHKAMVEILKSGSYHAVLPTLSIKSELEQNELINVGPKNLNSSLYLIHMDLEFEDKKIKALTQYLKSYLKENF